MIIPPRGSGYICSAGGATCHEGQKNGNIGFRAHGKVLTRRGRKCQLISQNIFILFAALATISARGISS
jgi:hypothetical protein